MKNMLRALTLLITLLAPGVALACTCVWGGPFTKVALGTELIVLVEVQSYYRHAMDVQVIEVLKGAKTPPAMRIWGDTGALCRPYVTAFPRGTRWIFALKPSTEGYAISVCGDYWLRVDGDQVVGRITLAEHGRNVESAPLADVLAWIRSGGATPIAPKPAPSGTPASPR